MSEYDLLKYFITIRNGCNKIWAAHKKFISNYKKFWLAYYHDLINSLPEYNVKIQFLSSFHRRENSLTGKDILNAVMLQISIRSDNRNLKSETNWRKKKYDGMLFWKKLQRKKSDYQNFATYEILRLLFRYSISNFGSYNNVNFKTYINGIRLIQQKTLLRFYFFFRYWPYLTWILFYSRYWLSLRLRPRPV